MNQLDQILFESTLIQEGINPQILSKIKSVVENRLNQKGIDTKDVQRSLVPKVKKIVMKVNDAQDVATFGDIVSAAIKYITQFLTSRNYPVSGLIIGLVLFLVFFFSGVYALVAYLSLVLALSPVVGTAFIIDLIIKLFRQQPPDQKAKIIAFKKVIAKKLNIPS